MLTYKKLKRGLTLEPIKLKHQIFKV